MPAVTYYLASSADPIDSSHPLWHRPLPCHRNPTAAATPATDTTYQDYFSAIADFCCAAGGAILLKAAARTLKCTLVPSDLSDLSIFLIKHGAFYHPARLRVRVAGRSISFVVNVAITTAGLETMPKEIQALTQINAERPFGWLPEVFGSTSSILPNGNRIALFLGRWFDDYHEFHLTRPAGYAANAITIWDSAEPPHLLSESQSADLYRDAAMILTACYDPLTTRQIFPWHHAAGDFVAKLDGERVSVRLVTARDYAPLRGPGGEPTDEADLMAALTLFFLHLTLRMRLDRLDGVGKVAWSTDMAVSPVIDGFFQGLDLTARLCGLPETMANIFRVWINRYTTAELRTLMNTIAGTMFPEGGEEQTVIGRHLECHLDAVRRRLAA